MPTQHVRHCYLSRFLKAYRRLAIMLFLTASTFMPSPCLNHYARVVRNCSRTVNVLHTSASVPRIPILPLMRKRNLYELTQDDINEIVTLRLQHEVFRFAQGNFYLGNKNKMNFILYCSRLFVTLALPKLLALGKAKEKQVFLLLFSRFFVTLPQNSR